MPKELTHWIIAEKSFSNLNPGPIREIISQNFSFYYLGAVVFDSPFYAKLYKNREKTDRAARRLHGIDGENTLIPCKNILQHSGEIEGRASDSAIAFIAGNITHICGDVHFHPLVNYFCGKYEDQNKHRQNQAQSRHRMFETRMDIHFLSKFTGNLRNSGKMSNLLRSLKGETDKVNELTSLLYWGKKEHLDMIQPLLRRHGLLQKQFFSPLWFFALSLIKWMLGGSFTTVHATFYPPRALKTAWKKKREPNPFFGTDIGYRHPNTGEQHLRSADTILDETVSHALELFAELDAALRKNALSTCFADSAMPSLDTGCDVHKFPVLTYTDLSRRIEDLCGKGR